MLSISKINGTENLYSSQNKKISFKSKFVPNDALNDAFTKAKSYTRFTLIHTDWEIQSARYFARIVDFLLKDGKDDLIKVKMNSASTSLIINDKRVNLHMEKPERDLVDGGRVINNFIDYFCTKKEIVDPTQLSKDEYNAIKSAINHLNIDLNADDAMKSPRILDNLMNNVETVNRTLRKNTLELLKNLESKIFNQKQEIIL